ncbi:hypothetical protein LEM8419_02781 [Neolewinella maritima]|uniref:Signal transduction histidine kinase internal region domain-containing protein n=1 Tax=Neolewinella maritima TaxID=1383882 RepID=A0ABM9B4P4_9BACT|nr:sensor histidine kinase [Neolewinella maritima]CAH1001873.1 hypothetical protein LEM8419_02781 [Neolewinella maritima]
MRIIEGMKQAYRITILQRGFGPDVAFWVAYSLLSQLIFAPDPFHGVNLLIMLAFLAAETVAVYGHLVFGLLPLVHKGRSLVAYLFVVAGCWAGGVLVGWVGIALVGLLEPIILSSTGPEQFLNFWLTRIGWSVGTLMALTGGLCLFAHRQRQAQREQDLQTAKTQAELAYLRGQLNPHFLFNALNSIYVLIGRDSELARECLLGFSDLLRYQLYASEADRVPLDDEIDQLRKFATLSRLRMEDGFHFELDAPTDSERTIPPLLLLPLVENAFKYSAGADGFVRARLTTSGTATCFTVANTVGARTPVRGEDGAGGIGLHNLRRRLDLLFPGRFLLDIEEGGGQFTVSLQLPHA